MTRATDTLSWLQYALAPLSGASIIDIGCGHGQLARRLSDLGAKVVAIDPAEDAVAAGQSAYPDLTFEVAGAEALPFAANHFDHAVFLNSLHHVPASDMADALREAARVIKPEGRIAVIEPLAQGSFFDVFRVIEDETVVRQQAQDALAESLDSATLVMVLDDVLDRVEHFRDLDAFINRVTAVNSERQDAVVRHRVQLEELFRNYATPAPDGGMILVQPLRMTLLRRPTASREESQ